MQPRLSLRVLMAISVAASAAGLLAPPEIGDPVVLLWSLICSGLMIKAARGHTGATRRTAWLLATTASLITIGFLVRGIHGEMVGEVQPMPSPADLLHVPGYLFFVATAFQVHRARAVRRNPDSWLDAGALILALVIMMWVVFLGDFILDGSLAVGLRVLNTIYNLLILAAGAVLLRITSTPGHRPVSYYILGFAGIAYFVADIAATYSLVRGTGLALAVGLSPLAYGLAAGAIRHPSAVMLTQEHKERELSVGPLRLFIVALTILAPLLTFGHDKGRASTLVLLVLSVLLASLVVTRVVRLLRLQETTAQLDRNLAGEVATLAALDSAAAIRETLPERAQHLLPKESTVSLAGERSATGASYDLPETLHDEGVRHAIVEGPELGPGHERVLRTLLRDAGLLAASAEGVAASARQASEAVANRKIAENERRFRALVQNSSDAVLVLDERAQVTYVSDSVEALTGHAVEEFIGRDLAWILHENDVDAAEKLFLSVIDGSNRQRLHEFRVRHADGSLRLFESIMTDMRHIPAVDGIVLNATDATERRSLERNLRDAETIDPLTLQLNRKAFLDEVDSALRRASITGAAVNIAIVDLDDFKIINEALGPMLADRVLVEVADRIRRAVRIGDVVARLSGDEFGVLMPEGFSAVEAVAAVERILADIRQPFVLEKRPIGLEATAGIALDASGGATATQLLRQADTALTQAKSHVPGQAIMFEESMALAVSERLDLRTSFAHALDEGQLRLAYQPIVDFATGRIVSLEALARWRHPERGEVSPSVFIPIAEESNFISELGEWALRTACLQLRAWDDLGLSGFTVSVNMSGHQLREDDVITRVRAILDETGVDPERITIEITESVLIDDTDFIAERIRMLRDIGLSLAIDDFGTGYSSLSYLQRYDFDILKIDRAFVRPLATMEMSREREIVAAIITLARGLGATTVAEGIEIDEEYAVLRTLGCDRAQGFLFYRPAECDQVAGILRDAAAQQRAA